MKSFMLILGQLLLLSYGLMAQQSEDPLNAAMGKWWKNSETANKLQLSEAKITQIEQTFLEHRSRLANLNAELKRHEAELRKLMQTDPINETLIQEQTENVSSARFALETANGSMMLAIRKVLSREQWAKLEEMRDASIYVVGMDGVKAPRVIRQPMPQYTQPARDAGIEGIVVMEAVIRKDGTVDSFRILRGLGYGLDESAMNTIAKEWRFEPGTKNGNPVDVRARIEVSFRRY